VHPIEGQATDLSGVLDVEITDGTVTALQGGRLEVPVRSLRSGNPLEDSELQRRVDARRFPAIVGELRSAAALDDAGRFRVDGDLTFHGVTEAVTGEALIAVEGDRVVLEGEHVFDVRRFGVTPPRILMLRVHPDVRVSIRLVAEPS
jgi:polyisoprenoid-binding protein YceI